MPRTKSNVINWLEADVEKKYSKKGELEHILELPDTQIGSTEFTNYNFWVPSETEEDGDVTFTKQDISFTPGLYKIIDEILVNAYDQTVRLKEIAKKVIDKENPDEDDYKESGIDFVKTIKIDIDKESGMISVYNDGEGIDVDIHKVHKVYVPQMIFGDMRTSSNYNKNETGIKIVGGRNGFGAKLANIFSTKFIVETIDGRRKKQFRQEYEKNMSKRHEPEVKKTTKKAYTRITFYPDLERFGYEDGMDDNLYSLVLKRAYDLAACTDPNINVYLNDSKIDCKTFEKYVSYYLGDKKQYPRAYKKFNDRWEVVACSSPDQKFDQVSFVNGVSTIRGGKHVEYITKQIVSKLKKYIETKKKIKTLKAEHVKDNLMIFVKCSVDGAAFDTQTKECLTTTSSKFGSTCEIDDTFIEFLANKCGVMEQVYNWYQVKSEINLKKTDGSNRRNHLNIPKLDDAGWAGSGKKAQLACLILTEGDSAKTLALSGRAAVKNDKGKPIGHDMFGVFPLKGKVMNVDGASAEKIMNNAEITYLKQILGLQEGKIYKDTKSLRYGSVLVMCDQDIDGSHIKGLLINLFKTKWPSLLELEGFLTSLLTPIVKARKGKTTKSFYSIPQYEKWLQKNNDGKGWNCKYYKGLGTSTPKEAKEYFEEFKKNVYTMEDVTATLNKIGLAFDKTRADDRKEWLKVYNRDETLDYSKTHIPFSDFIDKDLKHFSHEDNHRSIPHLIDGFKESQRKILFGFKKRGHIAKTGIKVAQIGAYVAEHSAYHHGEASIYGTIVNMAQTFVGSNNINLLEPIGQFGSRLQGGKDFASPRYIFTRMEEITNILFDDRDKPLYKNLVDDGQTIEPEFYVPIIPTVLINGSQGIGTGYSTSIPCYNPSDIIKSVKKIIAGKPIHDLIPWYRGFKGYIIKSGPTTFLTKGIYKVLDSKTVEITELPIGTWTQNYKNMLLKMAGEKIATKSPKKEKEEGKLRSKPIPKLLKKIDEGHSDTTVKFTLHFEDDVLDKLLDGAPDKKGINLFEKTFKLTSSLSINNMHLFDSNHCLKKYKNTTDIITEFCQVREQLYVKRRKYLLEELKKVKNLLSWKAKFIMCVISENEDEKIYINKKSKKNIYKQLENRKFPKQINGELIRLKDIEEIDEGDDDKAYNYLLNMPIYSLTQELIDKLLKDKADKEAEYDTLKEKTPIDLWVEDLDALEKAYASFTKAYWSSQGKDVEAEYNKYVEKKKKVNKKFKAKNKGVESDEE